MKTRPKAVLVSLLLPGLSADEMQSSLEELTRLVTTLGFDVIGTVTQRRPSPSPATAVGAGKVKELARWTGGTGLIPSYGKNEVEPVDEAYDESFTPTEQASKIVFDLDLTPNQLKNLEAATGAEVLDRTGVIVEIFHRHAKTREAQLQVEIARLRYLAPRLRAVGGGGREGGGIGNKGIGETAYELDRRRIRDRIADIETELESIRANRAQRRERRSEQLRVALVGYTNAGKSSLMRALTQNEVLVEDKLFATLDTTVRAMQPETFPRILVSDTVGFIQKLPHDLVASFRSTLDEAGDASLLLYVVDSSDPNFRKQLEVTRTVLGEIDADSVPSLLVLNKSDKLNRVELNLLKREFPEAVQISTREMADIVRLKQIITDRLTPDMREYELLVPYDDKTGLVGEIRRGAQVLSEHFEGNGVRLKIRTYPDTAATWQSRLKA